MTTRAESGGKGERLSAVEIRSFRGIREGTIEGLSDVNVLVGRNNSGKTTVAEAISRGSHDWSRGDRSRDAIGRDPHEYWQRARREAERVPVGVAPEPGQHTVVLRYGNHSWGATFMSQGTALTSISPNPWGERIPQAHCTVFRPGDLTDGSIDAALWPGLIAARRDKLLVQALNDIFGTRIEQLQLLPDGRFMLLLPDEGLSLDVFGDGTRAATRCLMVLAAMQDTMLILEEPESHQHPGSLARFAKALCTLARAQNVQLLLTTHSAECVRAFAEGSATAGAGFAVFHLKLDDGLLSVHRFDREAVETLTSTGVDVRFLDLYA